MNHRVEMNRRGRVDFGLPGTTYMQEGMMDKLMVLSFGLVALVTGLGQQVDPVGCLLNVPRLLTATLSSLHWLLRWLA